MISVLDYNSYQSFLKALIQSHKAVRGYHAKLSHAAQCQPSYLTRVLKDEASLTLDHALKLSVFLKMDEYETDYFLNLISYSKAATNDLKSFIKKKLKNIKNDKDFAGRKLGNALELLAKDENIFCSHWLYSCLISAMQIPQQNNVLNLSQFLNLPEHQIKQALDFLVSVNWVKQEDDKYFPVHVNNPMKLSRTSLASLYRSWSETVAQNILKNHPDDIHMMGTVALSEPDWVKIRTQLKKSIDRLVEEPLNKNKTKLIYVSIDCFGI